MGNLIRGEKKVLRLTAYDLVFTLDLEGSQERAGLFDSCMSRRRTLSSQTSRLSATRTRGEVDWTRRLGVGHAHPWRVPLSPKLFSAIPDGFELWAAINMHEAFGDV